MEDDDDFYATLADWLVKALFWLIWPKTLLQWLVWVVVFALALYIRKHLETVAGHPNTSHLI